MAIRNRALALAFRLIAAAVAFTGTVRLLEVFTGTVWWKMLFFTAQINVVATIWLAILAVTTLRELRRQGVRGATNPSVPIHGAIVLATTITMLIYTVVLVPMLSADGDYEAYTLTDSLVHVVTPLLMIGDWLLFTPKGRMRWVDPLWWLAIPTAYLAFAYTVHAFGGEFGPGVPYPYPFMDVETLGLGSVVMWLAALGAGVVALGYVIVAIDRGLARVGGRARSPQ